MRKTGTGSPLSATLVFCAYNEEASMAEKIANLRELKARTPELQFKAYVDLSTDRTLEMLREHGDLIDVVGATKRTGKAMGMRKLVGMISTDIVIFTDANVLLDPDAVPALLDHFACPDVGGVCGTLIYVNPSDSATATVNSVYWRLEERIKKEEARSGSTMGADGSIFATRRAYYPEVPAHLLDDFIVSMSTVFSGLRLISASDVCAYERLAASSSDEFRRKRRIACRAYSSHLHVAPQLARMSWKNKYKYYSHRWLRWYGAASATIATIFALIGIGDLFGAAWFGGALILIILGAATLFYSLVPGLSKFSEMAKAILATMLGITDAWRGKRYQTWQPVQNR
ncbi:glycosyltransferase [Stakelama sp. CBK3Z-3]|uniref:Glycosyltransferase n=1 Tax=Stakelama flava TaxID=2860338 RepID=A0ABS6XK37_9SPHN|nr:glycosyltransferase [Stakelama flava]MBW4330289.1 glycosyltransferase [Stakelama flava]